MSRAVWLGLGMVVAEALGVLGLVLVFSAPSANVIAGIICVFLIIVPILFGIAVRSELNCRRKRHGAD